MFFEYQVRSVLCLYALLHFVFLPLLVPNLELLVVTPDVVGANLVVEHAKHSTASIFTRQTNINGRLTSLGVVCNTCGGYLALHKSYPKQFCELKILQEIVDDVLCFLLGQDVALGLQVVGFRAKCF